MEVKVDTQQAQNWAPSQKCQRTWSSLEPSSRQSSFFSSSHSNCKALPPLPAPSFHSQHPLAALPPGWVGGRGWMEFVIEGFACLTCGLLKVASLSLGRQFEGDIVNVAVDCAQHSRTHTQHKLTLTLPHTHIHRNSAWGKKGCLTATGLVFFLRL